MSCPHLSTRTFGPFRARNQLIDIKVCADCGAIAVTHDSDASTTWNVPRSKTEAHNLGRQLLAATAMAAKDRLASALDRFAERLRIAAQRTDE